MGKRVGAYLVVVGITLYMFLMYNEAALSAILVLECVYPISSLLYLRWMRRRMTAGLGTVPAMGEKNKRIRMKIWIQNESSFWNCRYKVDLHIGSSLEVAETKKRPAVEGGFPAAGKSEAKKHRTGEISFLAAGTAEGAKRTERECCFSSEYCGRLGIRLGYLRIYDFFGIFFWRKKLEGKKAVGILPQYDLMPLEITRRTREFLADAEEHSVEKRGDDPSEIYQIREYHPRDSIHDIHWKLTAKEGELMVKEHGFPLGCVVLIWLDFSQKGATVAGFDRMVECAASLSMTLAEEKCIHMAAWIEEKNARVEKVKVGSTEAADELAWRLLYMEPYRDQDMAEVLYEDAFKGDHFSSIVTIDGQGELRVNEEKQILLQL